MISSSSRHDLMDRLHYTFSTADYRDIDDLVTALSLKENFEELCEEFFRGCRIDSRGCLQPEGFFADSDGSASLIYAMYEILGRAPDAFLLKHRVTRISFLREELSGRFRLPRVLFRLPRLEALTIKGIGISRFPEAAATAGNLRILDLSGNRFKEFPSIVEKFRSLAALNLSHNSLCSVPQGLGRLRGLKVLNLRGNKIKSVPADWHRLQNLRVLDLSMNRLTTVPDFIGTLVSLKEFRVAYNDLPAALEAHWEKTAGRTGRQGSLGIGG